MGKQSVYVIGATGEAGSSIVDGLLESGNFNIIAGTRPSSPTKPETSPLKSRGIEVRALDLENWSVDQVAERLRGADTVISAIFELQLQLQRPLADACKKAGVKRLIPCDWGPACMRGVRRMLDEKLDIQEYIKKTGVGYTFIDVGWWYVLPLPSETGTSASYPTPTPQGAYRSSILEHASTRFGSGGVKCANTDARTLNRYVFCWAEEVMQNEAPALARRGSSGKVEVKVEELPHDDADPLDRIHFDYWYSLWVKGDNTVENAKGAEYGAALDAGELYPDLGKDAALTRGVCGGSSLRAVLLTVYVLRNQHLERRNFLPNSVSSRLSFALILSTRACIIKTSALSSAS
ncbi:hypothetical protein ACEPAF_2473 [Sanghuangporus sanghuang]